MASSLISLIIFSIFLKKKIPVKREIIEGLEETREATKTGDMRLKIRV